MPRALPGQHAATPGATTITMQVCTVIVTAASAVRAEAPTLSLPLDPRCGSLRGSMIVAHQLGRPSDTQPGVSPCRAGTATLSHRRSPAQPTVCMVRAAWSPALDLTSALTKLVQLAELAATKEPSTASPALIAFGRAALRLHLFSAGHAKASAPSGEAN